MVSAIASSRFRCWALPSRISGEALTTQGSEPMDLVRQLLGGHLAGWDPSMVELVEKFRAREVCQLSRLALGDDALGVPLDRRGDAHLARELGGCQSKRAECGGFNLEADGCHGLSQR